MFLCLSSGVRASERVDRTASASINVSPSEEGKPKTHRRRDWCHERWRQSSYFQVQWMNASKVSCTDWMDVVWIAQSVWSLLSLCVWGLVTAYYGAAVIRPDVSRPTALYRHIPVHLLYLSVLIAEFTENGDPHLHCRPWRHTKSPLSQLFHKSVSALPVGSLCSGKCLFIYFCSSCSNSG